MLKDLFSKFFSSRKNGIPSKASNALSSEELFAKGRDYKYGSNGCEQNDKKAFECFLQSAEMGFPPAQLNIANWYLDGRGCDKNHRKAFEWYNKAAISGIPEAEYELFVFYHNGEIVQKDDNLAFEWLLKAVSHEDVDRLLHLGTPLDTYYLVIGSVFANGIGTNRNIAKAAEYYYKSAQLNNYRAAYELGLLYYNDQKYEYALEWYKKAAEGGYMMAQHNLALLLLAFKQIDQALYWLKIASQNGDESAADLINRISEDREELEKNLQ